MVVNNLIGNVFSRLNFVFLVIIILLSVRRSECGIEPLYNDKDDVISLKESNFDSEVLATSNTWLVEFYNSWCGHCIRYAKFYKRLATDIKAWRPFVKVAGVDCAQEYNTKLCQYFDIKAIPTLRFFPAFASKRTNGTSFPAFEILERLREKIVDYMSDSNISNFGSRRLRLLQPIGNFTDMWIPTERNSQKAVVIVEQPTSFLGRQVILDTYGQMRLSVHRMLAVDVSQYGISEVPSMFLVDNKEGSFKQLAVGTRRSEYVRALMNLKNGYVPNESSSTGLDTRSSVSTVNSSELLDGGLIDDKKNSSKQLEAKYTSTSDGFLEPRNFNLLADNYLKVHEQDLESSLHYSLRHEVSMFNSISDEPLLALKRYIGVLAKYLPVQRPISLFLKKVNLWLQKEPGPILGKDWLEAINHLQSSTEYLPASSKWTGCQGSEPRYRGYPCSLWTTFHTLSISAYDRVVEAHDAEDADGSDVKEVLVAIRGYVKFFFGCRECSQNFMKGAVHIEQNVVDAETGVLFLWRSHNRANQFLSGDVTEDLQHPKVQFPTLEQCPFCHALDSEGRPKAEFNEKAVLIFLQTMYSRKNLILDSARLWIGADDVEQSNDLGKDHKDSYHQKQEKEDLPPLKEIILDEKSLGDGDRMVEDGNQTHLKRVSFHGLGKLDIGMCVAFYVLCIGIIALLYLRFVRPRSLKMLNDTCRFTV